ncbi:MAG: TonB-dependent receptor [Schleiferiaceae bacterium]|nr:TonB-dependent receptor [Schleiferiaceae bacterium]
MKFIYRVFGSFLLILLTTATIAAQNKISGTVVDQEGEALPGANVYIKGTAIGTVTDKQGGFELALPSQNFTLKITFVGFKPFTKSFSVREGGLNLGKIALQAGDAALSEVEVIASRSTAESPFTFAELDKKEIKKNLGSRDLPNVLNISPSVYSTNQGGGAGDSRINIRGFDQRNVAVMINGVPVNDMENGWVYWSNWDGLGDAASSIQVQRGISPVNLSVPSVGGTINIVTDPAAQSQSVSLRQEVGSWNFAKTTLQYNTGLIDDKYAISANVVRKTGDGFYNGLFTDAWAYYVGASFKAGENDKLELHAVGAPQRHGQNLYQQNIARYSHEYARSLDDYDQGALQQYREAGRHFNQNYNGINPSYTGRQYFEMYRQYEEDRYDNSFLMERENFYHKPQINLNWYHTFSPNVSWSNVFYWSGGKGGGTGTYGDVNTDYSFQGMGLRQWNAEIAENSNNIDPTYDTDLNRSTGIMRNSVNQQRTYGVISKLFIQPSDELTYQIGVDGRYASIDHWREVRDLLGGDYFVYDGNDFDQTDDDFMKGIGEKIAYNNTNQVSWLGGYAQVEYDTELLTLFGMGGYTVVSYDYTDYFALDPETGEALNLQTDALPGFQLKGGASYQLTEDLNIYANGGYISRNPIFDYAINDGAGVVYDDIKNEKVTTAELGASYYMGNKFGLTANAYYTLWDDRTITQNVRRQNGDDDFIFIGGLAQRHTGIELSGSYQPNDKVKLSFGGSLGDWVFTDNVQATYTTYVNGSPRDTALNLYIKDLKVGDAPQNQLFATASVEPISGFTLQADFRYYTKFYSAFDPISRTDETDVDANGNATQSWQVPNYGLVDLHAFYNVPVKSGDYSLRLFAHVFNLFNEEYIQDATDNSRFNSFDGNHTADDAAAFFGLPRNFNAGLEIRF